MTTWSRPNAVMVVSGDHEYLRLREVRKSVMALSRLGRRVVQVEAGDSEGLAGVLSGGFMFAEPTLAVVESGVALSARKGKGGNPSSTESGAWSAEDVDAVVAHAQSGDPAEVVVLVHHPGDPPAKSLAARVAEAVPKKWRAEFPAPKPWEVAERASRFFVQEVKRRDKVVSEAVGDVVVRLVGTDFGVLAFEALKLSAYLTFEGRAEATPADLSKTIALLGGEDWQPLKAALASRDLRGVLQTLWEVRTGPLGESPMRVCAVLSSTVVTWLHAAALSEQGVGVDEAAARVKLHPFPYQKDVLPAGQRWGSAALGRLLIDISAAEDGIRRGHINPWAELESAVARACMSPGRVTR